MVKYFILQLIWQQDKEAAEPKVIKMAYCTFKLDLNTLVGPRHHQL